MIKSTALASFWILKMRSMGYARMKYYFKNTGTTYDWFRSYLKDRIQKVDIDRHISSETVFNIYVIQGSILRPIIFLIYINDLYNNIY